MKEIKDSLLSYIISKILSTKIQDYGEIVNLSIDSKRKKIMVEVLLKGENDTIQLKIDQYSLLDFGKKTYVTFDEVVTSREWLNVLIKEHLPQFLPEKKIEIPPDYAKWVKLIL